MADAFLSRMLTNSVRRAQRDAYGHSMAVRAAPPCDLLTEEEIAFIKARNSFYLATVNEDGWPYIQHRGGRPGFLHVLDPHTLVFADYRGNRQLLSSGHVLVHDKVALFLMDYPSRSRLKILGHARIETPDAHAPLVDRLPGSTRKLVERVVVIEVVGFDWNCSQHITPRYTLAELEAAVVPMATGVAGSEAELGAGTGCRRS